MGVKIWVPWCENEGETDEFYLVLVWMAGRQKKNQMHKKTPGDPLAGGIKIRKK